MILIYIFSGSPPSPAPPLPERTPESYELAIDKGKYYILNALYQTQDIVLYVLFKCVIINLINLDCHSAPVEQNLNVTQAVNLQRIGMSSEWFGNSIQATTDAHNETKSWARSKVRILP